MNKITMIPVEQLHHHPENPRKDLGDLSELTESIRKNGVMQNLTVVPGHMMSKKEWTDAARAEGADKQSAEASYRPEDAMVSDGYMVIIGNRRMEAAKAAGLTELPCVISDMDHRAQIATMLEENMQRADLTVYEQAQGFQMMMDLGFRPEEISEKTGFSETTVRRRLKMAEMDPKLLKKACEAKGTERQITMFDFERLAQVESIKERNELLKDIGDRNFDWALNRKLREQRAKAVKKDALKELKDAGIIQLKENEEYSSKYERMYNDSVDLADWKPGKKLIPKSKEQLYYYLNGDTVKFYTKAKPVEKAKPAQKTEAEKKKEAKIDNAWKIVDRITLNAQELRCEFVDGLTVKPSNAMQMLRWTIIAAMSDMLDHNYNNYTGIKTIFELEGAYRWDLVDSLEKQIMEMNQSQWPGLIQCLFEGWAEDQKKAETFACGYRKEFPKWQRNTRLEQCYKWLTEFGYQMSDEEIKMMAGTHPVFQVEVEA
jgi:ParB family chromosome partitioning protein